MTILSHDAQIIIPPVAGIADQLGVEDLAVKLLLRGFINVFQRLDQPRFAQTEGGIRFNARGRRSAGAARSLAAAFALSIAAGVPVAAAIAAAVPAAVAASAVAPAVAAPITPAVAATATSLTVSGKGRGAPDGSEDDFAGKKADGQQCRKHYFSEGFPVAAAKHRHERSTGSLFGTFRKLNQL